MSRIYARNTTFKNKNDIDVEVEFMAGHLSKLASHLTMDMKVYELKAKQEAKKHLPPHKVTPYIPEYKPRKSVLE